MIKLFDPVISDEEGEAAKSVIKSKFWASGSGINKVKKFEIKFNNFIGSKECVAVNSGTAALHLALSLLDLKGKEVLVPSITFVSTVNSIMYNGGIPIFVEVEPLTANIDISDVEKKITKKTVAIIPVHLAGLPVNIDKLKKIARDNKILIIEDAAHACGSNYKKKRIGTHSGMVCFSFHPVKNLAMPTGGAICLNDSKIIENKKILNSLRWCGIDNRDGTNYDVTRLGWNYYMNEISAAIGLIQLKKLDVLNQKRKNTAKEYHNRIHLKNKMPFSNDCSYHYYWIRVKNRSEFMRKMRKNGIETGIHYKPVHLMSYYKKKMKLPISELIGDEIVSLPTHPNLNEKNVNKIISLVNKIGKDY